MKITTFPMIALLLATAACGGKGGDAPSGQVVATVDGKEITTADLRFEAGGLSSDNPAIQKQIQQAALQSIINRHLLAAEAANQKIDQQPTAAMAKAKAEQMALIELLQQKMREGVPSPSREEAIQYVAENPSSFAERKIFIVDQIIVPNVPPAIVKQMEPLDTLEQIEGLLSQNKISSNRVVGTIDALSIDGKAAEQIAALAPGTVFVNPEGGGVRVNRIRGTEVRPLEGEAAIKLAMEGLQNRRIQAQVAQQMERIIKGGMAKVKYNDAFKPAPPPAQQTPVQGAPAKN